jgi:hypothetical protein
VAFVSLVACGGSSRSQSYGKAVSKQEACCDSIGNAHKRAQCVDRIVRVDRDTVTSSPASQSCADKAGAERDACIDGLVAQVRDSKTNRTTFHCVERHFVCDPATGTATAASSQKQLDCIADL